MTDYAKLYARLCGAIDEVLDKLGTIPEARHARERLQAAILDAEARYLDTAEENIPRETPERVPRGYVFLLQCQFLSLLCVCSD